MEILKISQYRRAVQQIQRWGNTFEVEGIIFYPEKAGITNKIDKILFFALIQQALINSMLTRNVKNFIPNESHSLGVEY